MSLFKTCLAATFLLILVSSCQKDPLYPVKETVGRMSLVGTYYGHRQQYFLDSSGINKHKIFEKEPLTLTIHPCKNNPNALVINNKLVVYLEKEATTFKELHLIHEQKCQGTESYHLCFDSKRPSLKLIVEKNLICNFKKGRILSIFEGTRIE
jgi:hypothetical protein